jgi:Cu(I)/Ag(I) efflux system membrane fusion protein
MNNKWILGSVVLIGLAIGLSWSYFSGTHHDHSNAHPENHQMHMEKNDSSHKMDHSEHTKNKMEKISVSDSLRSVLDKVIMAYFDLQKALSKDDLEQAKKTSAWMISKLTKGSHKGLSDSAESIWNHEKQAIKVSLRQIQNATTLSKARNSFEGLSKNIETLITRFGVPKGQHISKYHCPMVDKNKGASWLQNSEGTQNPYYGSQMFSCGNKVGDL